MLFARECSELHVNYAMDDIIELKGLTSCEMRASLFLFGSSKALAKEVYENFYECSEQKVNVNVERYRSEEVSHWLVNAIQFKNSQELVNVAFKKNITNLNDFISDIEINNRINCVEVANSFFDEKRSFKCGRTRLTIDVKPYVICSDAWRSLSNYSQTSK